MTSPLPTPGPNPLSHYLDLLLSPVQALQGADRVAATMAAIAKALTDGKMWRSLGWLTLGVALMGMGIWLILRPHVAKAAGQAGDIAELAALA